MKFFQEYEVKFRARVAAPSHARDLSVDLYDALSEALEGTKGIIVSGMSIVIEPVKGESDERSKTGI